MYKLFRILTPISNMMNFSKVTIAAFIFDGVFQLSSLTEDGLSKGKAYLIHQTVKEFILEDPGSNWYHFCQKEAECVLAKACITYLL